MLLVHTAKTFHSIYFQNIIQQIQYRALRCKPNKSIYKMDNSCWSMPRIIWHRKISTMNMLIWTIMPVSMLVHSPTFIITNMNFFIHVYKYYAYILPSMYLSVNFLSLVRKSQIQRQAKWLVQKWRAILTDKSVSVPPFLLKFLHTPSMVKMLS